MKEPIAITLAEGRDLEALRLLESGFLAEIGEAAMTDEGFARLKAAIGAAQIFFFLAKAGDVPIGMCSVAPSFSTFSCTWVGSLDDFYLSPAYRGTGVARQLIQAAQAWAAAQGYASLTVGASPGDVGMYKALGFGLELGALLAHVM